MVPLWFDSAAGFMGAEDSRTFEGVNGQWIEQKDHGNEVKVYARLDSVPHVLAVFDGEDKVSDDIAPLQEQNVHFMADGYSKAKEEYR